MAKQKKPRSLNESIVLIADLVNHAKVKSIRRIVKQLERMSPNDVQTIERLMGKR